MSSMTTALVLHESFMLKYWTFSVFETRFTVLTTDRGVTHLYVGYL